MKNQKGFTLIELIIVIILFAVIAITVTVCTVTVKAVNHVEEIGTIGAKIQNNYEETRQRDTTFAKEEGDTGW